MANSFASRLVPFCHFLAFLLLIFNFVLSYNLLYNALLLLNLHLLATLKHLPLRSSLLNLVVPTDHLLHVPVHLRAEVVVVLHLTELQACAQLLLGDQDVV